MGRIRGGMKNPTILRGVAMTLELADVMEKYPNPFFIVRPHLKGNGKCEDFEYVYVNEAFCKFIEKPRHVLLGHTFLECFHMQGERGWLNLFADVAQGQPHAYVESSSPVIGKRLFLESYHIPDGLCANIIHNYGEMSEELQMWANEDLLKKAHCDFLTGFYNRLYLNEQFEREMEQDHVGVTALDINNLKQVNDLYGHAAGDELIVRVSRMIRAMYRGSTVFRMGGDEFVIITVGMEREAFLDMSRCRQQVFEKDSVAAVGYRYFDHVDRLKDCIDLCDGLMYEHKRLEKVRCNDCPLRVGYEERNNPLKMCVVGN
jgi:diguanylate cyclase (GGDEF)-like protein